MTLLELITLLIVGAAGFAALNATTLKLPTAVGVLVLSLTASLGIIISDAYIDSFNITQDAKDMVNAMAFDSTLLEGMLGLLLLCRRFARQSQ